MEKFRDVEYDQDKNFIQFHFAFFLPSVDPAIAMVELTDDIIIFKNRVVFG